MANIPSNEEIHNCMETLKKLINMDRTDKWFLITEVNALVRAADILESILHFPTKD